MGATADTSPRCFFIQSFSLTTVSLERDELMNHLLVCLGLAHIYLNQLEALHL